jgi:hypothetical protein
MSAAVSTPARALDGKRRRVPTPAPGLDEAIRSGLDVARRREREAARRLADAIRRCEQEHTDAARRLAAFEALLDSTKTALRQRGYWAPVASSSPEDHRH